MNKQTTKTTRKKIESPNSLPTFLITEYSALRSELVKRMELQHQLISLALIAAGTFLSVGLEADSTIMILIYPFLAMFLASAWAQNDFWMRNIAFYIHYHIEDKLTGNNLGWEHNNPPGSKIPLFGSLSLFASRGIFVGTQLLAILISVLRTKFHFEDIVLFVLDGLIVIFTLILLKRRNAKVANPGN
ncbi:MAG TPA: hypothetical protein PK152_06150 [Anaerolineales bacterium]|nr:hypothetical protein [Anaerolineae bacterium]HRJ56413.1 hypothetical protein [Anaerolineales bacterium]HRK88695.1 hypothetical protein [Anaerolineales bacterium]